MKFHAVDITGGRGFGKIRFLVLIAWFCAGFVWGCKGAGDSQMVLWVLSYLVVLCGFSCFFAIFHTVLCVFLLK